MHQPRALRRVRSYFGVDLWQKPRAKRTKVISAVERTLRVGVLAVRGFFKDGAIHHASALSFDTVLALVPLLAIFFATLKGLGGYREFIDDTVRPWILSTFGETKDGQVGLREAFLQILEFGDRTELAPLGLLGLVLVLYLAGVLLHTVESVLNTIWGVQRPRSIARKIADYAAILFAAPFGLFVVSSLARWEAGIGWFGPSLHEVVVQIVSVVVACSFFVFLFLVMPHARTRVRSAVMGGVFAGVLWYAVLQLYAITQVGVARYNALYSSFAAIPLFLVFVFVSWLVVLFGAEIAAAHRDQTAFRWRLHHQDASPSVRRFVALRLLSLVMRAYAGAERPRTLDELAARAGVPEELAKDVLEAFVARNFLAHALVNGRPAFVPARDLSQVRVSDVTDVVLNVPDDETFAPDRSDDQGRAIARLLHDFDARAADQDENLTLGEFAARPGGA
jgi:membrane protein